MRTKCEERSVSDRNIGGVSWAGLTCASRNLVLKMADDIDAVRVEIKLDARHYPGLLFLVMGYQEVSWTDAIEVVSVCCGEVCSVHPAEKQERLEAIL